MVDAWDDEDFCDNECSMNNADFQKMTHKLGNDGYRIGKGQEEERQMQLGFNKGFSQGMVLGKLCGGLLGTIRNKLVEIEKMTGVLDTDKQQSVARLTVMLFEDIPESKSDIKLIFDDMTGLITSISHELLVAFEIFRTEFLQALRQ